MSKEKQTKRAVIVKDGNLLRIIGLTERAEIGFIHIDYPAFAMKRYFQKIESFLGYKIINLTPFMDEAEERLKELD